MSEERHITVECFRFDPDTDSSHRFERYQVPLEEEMSVLNALEHIYEHQDSSLAFYSCCRRGLCGRCAVRVNGRPVFSCQALLTGDVKVEPVAVKKVVRDLVIE